MTPAHGAAPPAPGTAPDAPAWPSGAARPEYDGLDFGPRELRTGSVVGHYRQSRDLVWAEFSGDNVQTGRLVGTVDAAGIIDAGYCQIMADGEVVAGRCVSTPTILTDGRLMLTERWHRTDGSAGESHIIELPRTPVGESEPSPAGVIEGV